ncbi:NAD-dependent epimerase/dehydratase family protein [Veillonella magna]|uniref:NAD-dependent epimerase/dehydratase family protein n=1 Tax=Veillonella magna TaxID=464322 RepID=UPI0023F4E018|nr:NAD-dependent epimerase/dehydratase family protein [Veillonella magna]
MNRLLEEDFENIILDPCVDWKRLSNSVICVTGATGLIGSLLTKFLLYYRKKENIDITVIALVRSLTKAELVFGDEYKNQIIYIEGDINNAISYDGKIDYIIHTASITESKKMVRQPVDTLLTGIEGTKNILNLSKKKAVKGVVYISSMEVYGITDVNKEKIREEDLGYIDNLALRSSYSEGKRVCELLCSSYSAQFGVPVKIARLAQTFGPGVREDETRVFAQFARSALTKTDIVLHTRGNSYGNYCYTSDVVKGILCLLTKGENGEAYNIVNENTTMKIKDMANLVAEKIAKNKIKVVIDIPKDLVALGYAPDVTLHLSSEKIEQLGWKASFGLEEMYRRMIESWKQ